MMEHKPMEEAYSSRRFNRVILLQGAVTLVLFALLTSGSLFLFRSEIRKQILDRDGTLLTSLAQYLYEKTEPADQAMALLDVALESSEIKDVIGVSLYGAQGENMASIPKDIYALNLPADSLAQLESGQPQIQYFPEIQMGSIFSDINSIIDEKLYPVTSVTAPVFDSKGQFVAAIQYWLDSEAVAIELRHLDQYLVLIGAIFITGGGIVFTLVFWISRNRILKLGLLLAEQNRSLQKANADLSMAARTSAIGSISSHLFHGLKNPLAGLKAYLQVAGHDEEVLEITTRMQTLIDESLAVIRDEEDLLNRNLSEQEFAEAARKRLTPNRDGLVSVDCAGKGTIPAHKAQLLLLVLGNLVDNAVEASPKTPVHVDFAFRENTLIAKVIDSGPGLPGHVREHIFEPVNSTKANGTGIGLAISAVITRHIPASLSLEKSDPDGTTFKINIPL